MRTHIKIVAIVNLLFSALGILAAAGVLFSGVFGSIFSGSLIGAVVGFAVSLQTGSPWLGVIAAIIAGDPGRTGVIALPGPAGLGHRHSVDDPGDGIAVGAGLDKHRACGIGGEAEPVVHPRRVTLGGDRKSVV